MSVSVLIIDYLTQPMLPCMYNKIYVCYVSWSLPRRKLPTGPITTRMGIQITLRARRIQFGFGAGYNLNGCVFSCILSN